MRVSNSSKYCPFSLEKIVLVLLSCHFQSFQICDKSGKLVRRGEGGVQQRFLCQWPNGSDSSSCSNRLPLYSLFIYIWIMTEFLKGPLCKRHVRTVWFKRKRLPRGRQVSHQRWIWRIHCMQVRMHASEGSTLALKPGADITRSPKQGYQWPTKRTHVLQFFLEKKKAEITEVPAGCRRGFNSISIVNPLPHHGLVPGYVRNGYSWVLFWDTLVFHDTHFCQIIWQI